MISLEFLLASGIGLLIATGVYLLLRARTFPVVLGLAMIGYGVNLFLFATGRIEVNAPAVLKTAVQSTDPLPQALVLTAIVIGFATTAFIVQLALRSRYESGNDHVDAKEDLPVGDDEVELDDKEREQNIPNEVADQSHTDLIVRTEKPEGEKNV